MLSKDWSFRMLALISAKHHVARCALSVLTNACVALLWQPVLWLFMCLFEQHDRRCRHVSFSLMLQRLHCGEMPCLSMYWPYQNLGICETCTSIIQSESRERFDPFGCRSLLVSHMLAYGMVLEASDMSVLLYSLSM